MANELSTYYVTTGSTAVYAIVRQQGAATIWNGSAFVALSGATWTACDIAATEAGSTRYYYADFPPGITTPATYDITFYVGTGGDPAASDTIIGVGEYTHGIAGSIDSGTAQTGTPTTITLASTATTFDPTATAGGAHYLVIYGGTGQGQEGRATAYNSTTKVATIDGTWETTPDSTSRYYRTYRAERRIKLRSDGLDSVTVETGLNARQALSVVAAATAGTLSGNATTTVTIAGAGVATNRITATVDTNNDRTAVTLSPPA